MRRAGWLELIRSVQGSYLSVLRAEAAALGEDLTGAAGRLGVALLLFFFAAGVALFALGALAFAAIAGLSLLLPAWAAALIVTAVLLLLAGLLALLARRRLRAIEGPGTLVRRRVADHMEWWEGRVTAGKRGSSTRERQEVEPSDDGAEEEVP
jgi:MFS family permease